MIQVGLDRSQGRFCEESGSSKAVQIQVKTQVSICYIERGSYNLWVYRATHELVLSLNHL